MLKTLLKFFMNILQRFCNMLLMPFTTAITALFPGVSTFFSYIYNFLNIGFIYFVTIRDLLLIPAGAMTLFFDYLLIKYSIYLIRLSLKLGIKIYNTFKL